MIYGCSLVEVTHWFLRRHFRGPTMAVSMLEMLTPLISHSTEKPSKLSLLATTLLPVSQLSWAPYHADLCVTQGRTKKCLQQKKREPWIPSGRSLTEKQWFRTQTFENGFQNGSFENTTETHFWKQFMSACSQSGRHRFVKVFTYRQIYLKT